MATTTFESGYYLLKSGVTIGSNASHTLSVEGVIDEVRLDYAFKTIGDLKAWSNMDSAFT